MPPAPAPLTPRFEAAQRGSRQLKIQVEPHGPFRRERPSNGPKDNIERTPGINPPTSETKANDRANLNTITFSTICPTGYPNLTSLLYTCSSESAATQDEKFTHTTTKKWTQKHKLKYTTKKYNKKKTNSLTLSSLRSGETKSATPGTVTEGAPLLTAACALENPVAAAEAMPDIADDADAAFLERRDSGMTRWTTKGCIKLL